MYTACLFIDFFNFKTIVFIHLHASSSLRRSFVGTAPENALVVRADFRGFNGGLSEVRTPALRALHPNPDEFRGWETACDRI